MRAEVTSLYTDNDLGLMVVCTILDGILRLNDSVTVLRDSNQVSTTKVLNMHKFGRQVTEAKAGNDYYSLILLRPFGIKVDDMLEST